MTNATAEMIGIQNMIHDLGRQPTGVVYADSAAALAIADRKGTGKLRHICRFVMAPGATDRGHDGLDAPVRSSAGRSPPSREKTNSIQYNSSDIRAPELVCIEIHRSTLINPYFRWTLALREELGARSTVAQVQFAFFYSGPRGTDFRTFGRFCIDFAASYHLQLKRCAFLFFVLSY